MKVSSSKRILKIGQGLTELQPTTRGTFFETQCIFATSASCVETENTGYSCVSYIQPTVTKGKSRIVFLAGRDKVTITRKWSKAQITRGLLSGRGPPTKPLVSLHRNNFTLDWKHPRCEPWWTASRVDIRNLTWSYISSNTGIIRLLCIR